ncbi:serine hydrolase domain-containing protein [Algirhabdus cladophorae]|uniref:serine hydrolase domain-containing protein n=1 Tax=Algirhabdus cladophorae TaxID=3377108 RepID=UPI003B84A530
MKLLGKLLRLLLVLAIIAAAIGIWKREELVRVAAVRTLFTQDNIVGNFINMRGAFLYTDMPRGDGPISALPTGTDVPLPPDAAAWLEDRQATSLLVTKAGNVTHESYFLGTTAQDRRISWSVAKSYLSVLTGILIAEGALPSVDVAVVDYVPALAGSAYADATLKDVLQMSSGAIFNEDYLDQSSDINKMGRTLALGGSMDEFATSVTGSFQAPGVGWKYTSIDTHILGMVLRAATGQSVATMVAEKILIPLGPEADSYYLTDGYEVAFVLGGLNTTTRDYARFGLMIANGGAWNGQQIVPNDWIVESTTPSAKTAPGTTQYGYQWWMASDATPREYFARGVYGQYIYIDEATDVVVVLTSADRRFREQGRAREDIEMFRAIAALQ